MAECPKEALSDSTLPPMARILLTVLWSYAGRGKRFVWPSTQTLAQGTGMSQRAVQRNLLTLRKREWVTPAESEAGRSGWWLCDPPGVRRHVAHEAPMAEVSPDASVRVGDAGVAGDDADVATLETEATLTSSKSDAGVVPHLYRNQPRTIRQDLSPTVQESAGTSVQEAAVSAAPSGPDATAWAADFTWRWRERFGGHDGRPLVPNPTSGARRWRALQEALDDFGAETVAAALMHAGGEVQRRLEASGDERVGMHPGKLHVAFRLEAGSFPVLLNDWQAAQGRKRRSGAIPAAPAELDGEPLTDDEQRVWMLAMGADPAGAVRRKREETSRGAALVGELLGSLEFGGVG